MCFRLKTPFVNFFDFFLTKLPMKLTFLKADFCYIAMSMHYAIMYCVDISNIKVVFNLFVSSSLKSPTDS